MSMQAVFLDRDGTLIEYRPYLSSPSDVVLLPGVREALQIAKDRNVKLFLFTNQSGIGRGYFTLADVDAVNARMLDLLGLGKDLFTAICIAPETPDDLPVYRKPSPRFIEEILAEHRIPRDAAWMVGDAPSDWQSGINAGVRVAAIVTRAETESRRALRQELCLDAYPSLLAWLQAVLAPTCR